MTRAIPPCGIRTQTMANSFVVAFEGPDGVGKSSLIQRLKHRLDRAGIPCEMASFPGRDTGSLGKLVYELHHSPSAHGIRRIHPTAMQALHIAAHLDFLEGLKDRKVILLDRFWWSTLVYGKVSGANAAAIRGLVAVEKELWRQHSYAVILIARRKKRPTAGRRALEQEYRRLAARENGHYPIEIFTNEADLDASATALSKIVTRLIHASRGKITVR